MCPAIRHLLLLLAGKAPNGSELENVICNCMEKKMEKEEKEWIEIVGPCKLSFCCSEKIKSLQKHGRGNREKKPKEIVGHSTYKLTILDNILQENINYINTGEKQRSSWSMPNLSLLTYNSK